MTAFLTDDILVIPECSSYGFACDRGLLTSENHEENENTFMEECSSEIEFLAGVTTNLPLANEVKELRRSMKPETFRKDLNDTSRYQLYLEGNFNFTRSLSVDLNKSSKLHFLISPISSIVYEIPFTDKNAITTSKDNFISSCPDEICTNDDKLNYLNSHGLNPSIAPMVLHRPLSIQSFVEGQPSFREGKLNYHIVEASGNLYVHKFVTKTIHKDYRSLTSFDTKTIEQLPFIDENIFVQKSVCNGQNRAVLSIIL